MNTSYAISLALLLCFCACQERGSAPKKDPAADSTGTLDYSVADSLPLFNESHAYSYINLQKIDSGITIAFQHPGLSLDLIDNKGHFIRKVGTKGNLPEDFKGDYLETSYSDNGRFYVLDESAAVWLKVYDASLNYLKTINLHRYIKDYTVPPVTGNFVVRSVNDSIDRFVVTPISTVMNPTDKSFYTRNPVLIQFDLNLRDYSVYNITKVMSLSDISSIAAALRNNEKKWEDAVPLLRYYRHQFYVKFPFDNDIYQYDTSWNLTNKYVLHPTYATYDFATEFKAEKENMKKSFLNQMKFQFCNQSYNSMCIAGDKIYLLYPRPIDPDKVPASPQEWQKFLPTAVLHVLDMTSNRQYSAEMPSTANTFFLHPVSDSSLYITQHPFASEDLYAYKINVSITNQ